MNMNCIYAYENNNPFKYLQSTRLQLLTLINKIHKIIVFI